MSDGTGRARYLVECYWPSVDAVQVAALAGRTRAAAGALRHQGRDLRFLWSILVPADETVFYFFDGDETDVRTVSEQAGVRFERVLEWVRIDGRPNADDKA